MVNFVEFTWLCVHVTLTADVLSPLIFQIIVYCREREERKFFFPCNQWLAKDEGDGQIVRQLTASTDSSAAFQGKVC